MRCFSYTCIKKDTNNKTYIRSMGWDKKRGKGGESKGSEVVYRERPLRRTKHQISKVPTYPYNGYVTLPFSWYLKGLRVLVFRFRKVLRFFVVFCVALWVRREEAPFFLEVLKKSVFGVWFYKKFWEWVGFP